MNRSAALALLLAVALAVPEPAHAQRKLISAGIGTVLGTGAGGYVALGVIALQARHGTYLFNLQDAFGWESAAVLAGGGTGLALGLWDEGRLLNTVAATTSLGLVGTAIGVVVGHHIWPPPEGKWAGGVIGGGAGILAGAVVGVLLPPDLFKEEDGGIPILIRIPVGG